MRSAATLLVWLSFLVGLPQVLICGVTMLSAGWWAPLVALFALPPLVPLILMQEYRGWRRLNPVVPAIAAILSIAVSGGFYWELFTKMQR